MLKIEKNKKSSRKLYMKKFVFDVSKYLNEKFGNIVNIKKIIAFCYFDKSFEDNKFYQRMIEDDLFNVFGKKPVDIKAKQSVSNYKVRKGMIMGKKVVLGRKDSFELIERLSDPSIFSNINYYFSKAKMDKKGNLNFGLNDQITLLGGPIKENKCVFGMNICIVFARSNKFKNAELLKLFKNFERSIKINKEQKVKFY